MGAGGELVIRWAVALAVVAAGALLWPQETPQPASPGTTAPLPALPLPTPGVAPASAVTAALAAASAPVPEAPPDAAPAPAHWSMADAREHGDERTPPLQRAPEPQAAVSGWELSDHEAYARREADLRARARADYLRATDAYLPELADGIARGRAAGVPPEAIAKMEAKLKRLQALRDELAHPAN